MNPISHYIQYKDRAGASLRFVEFKEPSFLLSWETLNEPTSSYGEATCKGVKVKNVEIEVLKTLEVWDKLSKEVQKEVKEYEASYHNEVHNKMDKARRGRRQRYPNIPREMVCCKCKIKEGVVPAVIAKKLEKDDITIESFIEKYECRVCCPRKRGRQANPAYAHLPKELVCNCGVKVVTTPSSIVQRAKNKKMTPEEFIKQYVCQICNPTKGRKKGQKNKK